MTSVAHEDAGSGTMPRGEGDFTIEGHGIEPVPTSARYGSPYRVFTVWFTPNLVPAAFAIGTLAWLRIRKAHAADRLIEEANS